MADKVAKPFLKWAGGKTQLITEIEKTMPGNFYKDSFTYIERFYGNSSNGDNLVFSYLLILILIFYSFIEKDFYFNF